jgi:hypothetical protein
VSFVKTFVFFAVIFFTAKNTEEKPKNTKAIPFSACHPDPPTGGEGSAWL